MLSTLSFLSEKVVIFEGNNSILCITTWHFSENLLHFHKKNDLQSYEHGGYTKKSQTNQNWSVIQLQVLWIVDLKSDNLQYTMLGRWVAGMNDSLTKFLMLQVLLLFHKFLQNSLQNLFQLIFLWFYKKMKSFGCP